MMECRIRVYDDGRRLHLKWYADDSGLWHQILDDFKATFRSHGERSYSSATRTWSVPLWCRRQLHEWCDYWFPVDAQQWDAEEPSGHGYSHTYSDRSYGRYKRPQPGASTIDAAYAQLCLTADAPPELVRVVHHFWVKELHPDTGRGDGARLAKINAAVDTIKEDSERMAS